MQLVSSLTTFLRYYAVFLKLSDTDAIHNLKLEAKVWFLLLYQKTIVSSIYAPCPHNQNVNHVQTQQGNRENKIKIKTCKEDMSYVDEV